MSKVTIYLDEENLAAAKEAAAKANLSVSRWFAQFAEMEKTKRGRNRQAFWTEIDRLRAAGGSDGLDFLLGPDRYSDLGEDIPREFSRVPGLKLEDWHD